jgi:hypothetical protein
MLVLQPHGIIGSGVAKYFTVNIRHFQLGFVDTRDLKREQGGMLEILSTL